MALANESIALSRALYASCHSRATVSGSLPFKLKRGNDFLLSSLVSMIVNKGHEVIKPAKAGEKAPRIGEPGVSQCA